MFPAKEYLPAPPAVKRPRGLNGGHVHLTRFVFLKKGHHFLNALFAYKAQAKVAGKIAKSKHKVRIKDHQKHFLPGPAMQHSSTAQPP